MNALFVCSANGAAAIEIGKTHEYVIWYYRSAAIDLCRFCTADAFLSRV
jgi:hypothetical protein